VSAVVFINWMEKLHRRQPILSQLFGVIRDRRDHPVESSLYLPTFKAGNKILKSWARKQPSGDGFTG